MSDEPGGTPDLPSGSADQAVVGAPPAGGTTIASVPSADDLEKRFDLLLDATRRERERTASRASATQTRATVLIGATGLIAGVDGGSNMGGWAFLLLGLAIGFGIWALVPRSVGVSPVKKIKQKVTAYAAVLDVKETLLGFEIAAEDSAAKVVKFRSWLVNIGFTCMALGIGISLIGGWEAQSAKSTQPAPTPSPIQIEIVR